MDLDELKVGRPWGSTWDVFNPEVWTKTERPVNRRVGDIRTVLIGQGVSECRNDTKT